MSELQVSDDSGVKAVLMGMVLPSLFLVRSTAFTLESIHNEAHHVVNSVCVAHIQYRAAIPALF